MDTQAKKHTILIVEDEVSMLNALRDKFTHEDFSIFEAKNGEEGLEIALREHPDIILLDIFMPKMDGMTMLDLLRKEADGKSAKVIILTNLEPNDAILQKVVKDLPVYYFIKSETTLDHLIEKIKELLSDD